VFLRKHKRDCERGQRKKKRGYKVAAPTIGIRSKAVTVARRTPCELEVGGAR
jgi:hypothetical protein